MAAEGRPCLRAAVMAASTILDNHTRARGAMRRFQIAVSFFRFSSATELTAPRADGARELRRHRRLPPLLPLRRDGSPPCFLSGIPGWRGGGLYPLAVAPSGVAAPAI